MAEGIERQLEQENQRNQESLAHIIKDVQARREDDSLPPGVESWMTRVEKAVPQTTITDGHTGQTVMQPASQQSAKALPVTRATFSAGFKKAVAEANRWLSEFIFRIIKMNGGKVEFKKEEMGSM